MRLALAQINTVVGDLDGNRDADPRPARRGARGGRRPRPLPRARRHGLSAGGPAAAPGVRARGGALARRDRGRDRRDHGARRRPRFDARPLQRLRRLLGRRGRRPSTASGSCRTTASSTSTAISPPARDLLLLRSGESLVGLDGLRGHVAARPAGDRPRARGRAAARQHLRLAVPRRQGARARGDVPARARDNVCFVAFVQHGRRPGRARSSTATRACSTTRARSSRGRRDSRRRCSSSTSTRQQRWGGGCATCGGGRSRASASAARCEHGRARAARQRPARRRRQARRRAARAGARADAARARARPARLRRQERLLGHRRRALGRDRLGAHRRARGRRRSGRSACTASRCRHASPPKERAATRSGSPRALGIDFREIPIEPIVEAFDEALAQRSTGRDRDLTEENIQARVRGVAADGALEQVRLARRRDREQVGALGRLRDAVRRHGRRVRAPEGRVQDRRVPALAPPERARRPGADPADDHRPRTERRAARQPARPGLAAAVPGARPGARGVRRARPLARRALARRLRPRTSSTARWR